MTYGILASGSCILTDVVDQLHEDSKKVNSVERLTRHLNNGTPSTALKSYLTKIKTVLNFYITLKTAILNASKIRQIGALGSCVHFRITFCGNSSFQSLPIANVLQNCYNSFVLS